MATTTTTSNKHTTIKHLVLSGGGLLGISYIGLFKYFEEKNYIKTLESITGSSAGALFGSLCALGYTSNEIKLIIKQIVFKDYLKINIDSILNFTTKKGLESGNTMSLLMKKCIYDKTNNENLTFIQHYEKYNIKLQIGVTNLSQHKFELLNKDTYPDLPIHTAISASIAIPFIFEPVIINNDIYCDGGILNNLPIDNIIEMDLINNITTATTTATATTSQKLEDNPIIIPSPNTKPELINENLNQEEKTKDSLSVLGFYLINKGDSVTKDNYKSITIAQYISLFTRTLSKCIVNTKIEKTHINKDKYKIINIEIPCDIMTFIKLDATHDDIDNIISIAYNVTLHELE
jgi:predicted acylesterase/phospholipase RssA